MKELFEDYLSDSKKTDLKKLCLEIKTGLDRETLVHLLKTQNTQASISVAKNIELLKNEKTFVVITGQQLGLMGGPLYTIYKILNTVKLCKDLEKLYNTRKFVPVFWMESEDADFNEVSHVTYFREYELRKFVYQDQKNSGRSIGRRELNLDINRLSLTLGFEQPFESERNWLEAFYTYYKAIFDKHGIIVFHSNREDVKNQTIFFFKNLIKNYEFFRKSVFDETEYLRRENFRIQVPLKTDESFLFTQEVSGRRKLKLSEMTSISLKNLSTNVLLRPLYQDWIFPSVIYVAGEAEISYHLQLKKAYRLIERLPPMLFPRTHHIILNPKMERLLKRYQFNSEYNLKNFDKWKNKILKSERHDRLDTLVESVKLSQEKFFQSLKEINFSDMKTQNRILESAQIREEKLILQLRRKISNILKNQDMNKLAHIKYLRLMLFPNEKLQERIFTISQFNENALIFAQQIFDQMNIFDQKIQINTVK